MQVLHSQRLNKGDDSTTPLVLLHGFLGELNDWQCLVNALPKELSCYGIDLPGHGGSKDICLSAEDGFAHCSQLLSATLAQLKLNNVILLGYSLGGRIAMYHASKHPEQLTALIIESAHFGLADNSEKQQRLKADYAWAERFATEPLTQVLSDWYQQSVFISLSDQQRNELIAQKKTLNGMAVAQMLRATSLAKQDLLLGSLNKHIMPSYYFCGVKDKKYQIIAQQFQQTDSALHTFIINDAGHNVHFEQPKIYAEHLSKIYTKN